VRPPSKPVRPPSESLSTKRSPSSTIVPGTPVYAVWFDDDGLAYEVC
jgi:hypothetical protein